MDTVILILTVLAGCLMPVQPAVNAVTAYWMKSPYLASFFSFLTGTLALGLLCIVLRQPWPDGKVLASLPWWAWTAGSMGAFFVTMSIVAVPRLGAMSVMALFITGQMGMSLVMDHFGWLGIPAQPMSAWRVLGAVLLLAGVVLIRKF
jgi:transporter family-2 protein